MANAPTDDRLVLPGAPPQITSAAGEGGAPPGLREVVERLDTLIALMREQAQRIAPREVLNAKEAAAFVGKPSVEAFSEWRKAHNVRPCGHGRYSLRSLKAGLERESRKTYLHAEDGV